MDIDMYKSIVCNYYDTVMQLVREVTRKVVIMSPIPYMQLHGSVLNLMRFFTPWCRNQDPMASVPATPAILGHPPTNIVKGLEDAW